MLDVAFKEWAAVCQALADGQQTIILRKGGVAEAGNEFRPNHTRFWLYPTYFHAQEAALVPSAAKLVNIAFANSPPSGKICLTHFVEVTSAFHVSTLESALALGGHHIWSADTVRQRFHYRSPGLFVITARVYMVDHPAIIPDDPSYAGCKTWVKLTHGAEEIPAKPVISDEAFAASIASIPLPIDAALLCKK